MDFTLSEERQLLQDTVRRLVAKEYGFEARNAITRSAEGYSAPVWQQFAEIGLLGLGTPEDDGGMGGDGVDTMIVMEAFGRGLVVEPYVPTVVLCGGLIRDAGSIEQRAAILPAMIGGETLMALAHYEPASRYELNHVATTAKPETGGWRLSGRKSLVLGGPLANTLIVSARSAGSERDDAGVSMFLVDAKAAGVKLTAYSTHDGQRAADVVLEDVDVAATALLGPRDQALPFISRAIDRACAALCAEAVGAIDAMNEATLEYLKTRKQFGQPIGRFQALQHRMARMTLNAVQARSMMCLAAVYGDAEDAAERQRNVSAAKALIGQAARFVGQQSIQLHGGMGVTDELMVGHYFKRLTVINASFGDADHHLGRFSDSLLKQ